MGKLYINGKKVKNRWGGGGGGGFKLKENKPTPYIYALKFLSSSKLSTLLTDP